MVLDLHYHYGYVVLFKLFGLFPFGFKPFIFDIILQLDEWWEQPASTVVDWVTVDGQNVAAWHNHVKQLLAFYDKELL